MMKKKYVRLISIFLAVAVLIILLFNFGVNFWLRNNLSDYIKKNSDYKVSYKSLNVDLFTGDIAAAGITVANKNPDDHNVIGLRGSVDTLSISRLGVYEAVLNKRINSNRLLLVKPELQITLAKPRDEKTGKKRNPVLFKNITIKNGDVSIVRHTGQKFLAANDLNLNLENIQLTEESVERKLPLAFDNYEISGRNFFFRPDNVYAVTAKLITTEAGQMSIKNFAVVPLLSFANFLKFKPKEKNLYDFKTAEMNFKDISLTKNKISLRHAHFLNPVFKVMTTGAKPQTEKKKDLQFEVDMEDVLFKNAKITVLQPDGTPKLSAGNLNVNIQKFLMDGETSKSPVPFQYANFGIVGRQLYFATETQLIDIGSLNFNPKGAEIRNISFNPKTKNADKTVLDIDIQKVQLKIDELKFVENKLKLAVQSMLIDGGRGHIFVGKSGAKKKFGFSGIQFPLTVKEVKLTNSGFAFNQNDQPMTFSGVAAVIQNIEMTETTAKNAIPFKTGKYNLKTRNFTYSAKFYKMSAEAVSVNNNAMQLSNFAMLPKVSRAQFIQMIPAEKDLYTIKVNQITMNGSWDLLADRQYLDASQVTLNKMEANIFRSKIPKDDLSEKPLYSKLLRSMKLPMFIKNLDLKNAALEYEEDTKKSDGPGKLTFNNLGINVKNLNSNKLNGKPTQVEVAIKCRFMNSSPMNVKWNFNTADQRDTFSISGNVADLPAAHVNPFIEPYLKIRATGLISDLIFNFKGNNSGLNGSLNLKHQDLKVSVLKEDGEKNKVLSAVANIFVRTNSGKYPESVRVDNVPRDKAKSFFNLFWKGIEEGLKKTLIGTNVEKTEAAVKNTVSNAKEALDENKKDLQERRENVTKKVQQTKQNVAEKTTGLKNLFRKKSE